MPVSKPIAVANRGVPARAPSIPKGVKAACLAMIHDGIDFIAAARAHGLRPDTLRRWLHRPECISFVKRERAAYRLAVCCGNEHALVKIRDDPAGNSMAKVRSVQALEGIEDSEVAKPGNSTQPGVTIRIVNVVQDRAAQGRVIDVTPSPPTSRVTTAPIEPPEPIFRP
jgi:hypothetical protein